MNIYNFIYGSFYIDGEKNGDDGGLMGSAYVFLTLLIHLHLIFEIILDETGHELSIFPNYENLTYTARKSAYALHLVPYFVVVWSFYNRRRSDRLIEDYEEEYGEEGKGKIPRILLIMVAPAVVLFFYP